MEHLEMAGAPAETPGTVGLTINDLPDDMITNIFSMMDIKSLLVVAKVCTRWQQLCETPYVWKYACLNVDYFNYKGIIKNILPIVGKFLKKVKISFHFDKLRASLIRYCPNLTHIELEMWELHISTLYDLHHWPNLKFLNFDIKTTVKHDPNSGFNMPFVAKELKTLKLHNRYSPTTAKFRAYLMRSCSNLTHLEMYSSEVDSGIFDDLHLLPNLKFLSFYYSAIVEPHRPDLPYRNSAYNLPFEKLKYLETLILSYYISLTRNSLYSMLECENLVNINMKDMRDIPVDFLESLVRNKQSTLRELHIYGDTLNDDIMRHISNCKQLQVLHIETCDTLSDSILPHFSRLKNLQSLKLVYGNFSENAMLSFILNSSFFRKLSYLSVPKCFPPLFIKILKTNAPNLVGEIHQTFIEQHQQC